MNQSRQLASILIVLGIVLSVVYGTGAFDSASTQRDASVDVVGDASSYLALTPAEGPNGAYASQVNGKLRVSLSPSQTESLGDGVNSNAVTVVSDVFTITNQGTGPVTVWLNDSSDRVTFETENGPIDRSENAMELTSGEQQAVGIRVDTRGYTGKAETLLSSMTIHASSDGTGPAVDDSSSDPTGNQSRSENSNPETDDSITGPAMPGGSPELSGDMKTRMGELHSELAEEPKNDDNSLGDKLIGVAGTVTSTVSRTLPGNSETYVFRSGSWVLRKGTVVLASGIMLLEHGSQPAGGPATTHGALTTLAVYPPDATGGQFTSPLRLPTGAGGYETPSGNERIFGIEQLTQLPGFTRKNTPTAVGEILKQPNKVRSEDGYTVVVGDNPHGNGEITLWIYEGYVVKGTTEEMEEVKNDESAQYEHEQHQQEENDEEKTPRRKIQNGSRLLSDGGGKKEDHQAMNDLIDKGVPRETVIEWSNNKEYNVQGMNKALEQYQNSGKRLPNSKSGAQGKFGEIVAKDVITDMYPSTEGHRYIPEVELKDKNDMDITEIDWVVANDESNEVIATFQVKSGKGKHSDAQSQIKSEKDAFNNNTVDHLEESQGVSVSDFESNLNNIHHYTVGPQDDSSYDKEFGLTSKELDALLGVIRENNP